jgi:hypothetical protein
VAVPFLASLCTSGGSAIAAALRLVHAALSIAEGASVEEAENNAQHCVDQSTAFDQSKLTAASVTACAGASGLATDAVKMSEVSAASMLSLCKAGALAAVPFRRHGGSSGGGSTLLTWDGSGDLDIAIVVVRCVVRVCTSPSYRATSFFHDCIALSHAPRSLL